MNKHDSQNPDPRILDRRAFLRLSGLLGLGLASAGIFPSSSEAVKFDRKMNKVSSTRIAMGTFVSMILIHPSRDEAEEAMGRAFQEIGRLTAIMSRFDEATAVAQLNREGLVKDVPFEVIEVVSQAKDYHRISRGTFDVSVKPIVDLFVEKLVIKKGLPPSESEIEEALQCVGSDQIELHGRNIRFRKQGMGITLDGIAKGYIVDKAAEVLINHKIDNHLINAGGDIKTAGKKGNGRPWTIAIQDPEKKRPYPDKIEMTDGAIATSGNYEIYFDREKMYHHIVDPKTGRSPELNASVSVLSNTAMDADALSTSVFVMHPLSGIQFIDSMPHCECLVMSKEGKTLKSRGWKSSDS